MTYCRMVGVIGLLLLLGVAPAMAERPLIYTKTQHHGLVSHIWIYSKVSLEKTLLSHNATAITLTLPRAMNGSLEEVGEALSERIERVGFTAAHNEIMLMLRPSAAVTHIRMHRGKDHVRLDIEWEEGARGDSASRAEPRIVWEPYEGGGRLRTAHRVATSSFVREGRTWLIWDKPLPMDIITSLVASLSHIREPSVLTTSEATALIMTLEEGYHLRTHYTALEWELEVHSNSDETLAEERHFMRPHLDANQLLIEGGAPSTPLYFTDPLIGDSVMVIPYNDNVAYEGRVRDYVHYQLLPSLQGMVFIRANDTITPHIEKGRLSLPWPLGREEPE